MFRAIRWFGVSALVFVVLAGINPTGVSGGGKGKDKDKAKSLTAIEALSLAGKMEDLGKAAKSPAALLAAAELYWSIVPNSVKELKDVEVKTEEPKEGEKGDPAPKVVKGDDPRDIANKLFDLALEYAKPNEESGVKELIKGIKGTLGSMKGPHTVYMTIGGKQTQTITIHFKGGQLAQLAFRCTNGAPLQVRINGPNVGAQDYCVNGNVSWIPHTTGPVHVQVHNPHPHAMAYHVAVN